MNIKQRLAIELFRQTPGDSIPARIRAIWPILRKVCDPKGRAPNPFQKLGHNTGCRKDYICPIGEMLDIDGTLGSWGSHSSQWPRTQQSHDAFRSIKNTVCSWFKKHS